MKHLAKNFVAQVDRFLDSNNSEDTEKFSVQSVIDFMPFSTLRLRGRNANRIVRPLLKVMHKATSKFYVAQMEENDRLQEKISELEYRLIKIEEKHEKK